MHSPTVTANPVYPQAELWQQPSWPLQPSKSPKSPGGWGHGRSGASSTSAPGSGLFSLWQQDQALGLDPGCWLCWGGFLCKCPGWPQGSAGGTVRAAVTCLYLLFSGWALKQGPCLGYTSTAGVGPRGRGTGADHGGGRAWPGITPRALEVVVSLGFRATPRVAEGS